MNLTVGRACPQRAESDVFHARRAARRDGLALPGSWGECMVPRPRELSTNLNATTDDTDDTDKTASASAKSVESVVKKI